MAIPIDDPRRIRSKLLARFAASQPSRDVRIAAEEIDVAIQRMLDGITGPTRWNQIEQTYERQ